MNLDGTHQWLLHAMDIYDKEGLYPGSAALGNIEQFAREYRLSHITVTLEQVRGVLETILCGLSGRNLKIEAGNRIFTDTETLYLPVAINRFNEREKNYQLYKVTAVHVWAQTWFGTFKRPTPDAPHLSEIIGNFSDSGRALKLFNLLETFRLNACLHRELPGLGREMLELHTPPPVHDATWEKMIRTLEASQATVIETLAATTQLYHRQLAWPDAFLYQGGFNLNAAELTIDQRIELEKSQLQAALNAIVEAQRDAADDDDDAARAQNVDANVEANQDENGAAQLTLDGEPLFLPPDTGRLLSSLLQDFDNIPEHWLVPAGDGDDAQNKNKAEDAWPDDRREPGAFLYDEWDFRRQAYRKNWCVLREMTTAPIYDDFPENTLQRYVHLVGDIRKHFEVLRGEDKILKAQPIGDNIDLDALVTAHTDMQTGVEMTDRLYTHRRKQERDLAVIFMVDVSGSTKGWINDAERESLILLCQALEILGDQYAIYGFSGMTRNRCEVYKIKTFEQNYDKDVRARISGLRPQDYTRMGVTIRHLTGILNQVEAKTRILITLSDGKPDDYDGYRGDYGIEDTRQALLEARHTGVHPFCITIDTEASDYLPHMYGHASFVVVDEVRKLPLKVADIYRRLTT
ncbi:nitric oxide reductase activation protein NorD [Candidatus Spongiihabitans sp.]|uniref:nitric oxide reductase activation protein NorD n=1 Tax=Candidatus Spongiihabitans sp. TaxID=3101308 RepID=UPI003C7EC584